MFYKKNMVKCLNCDDIIESISSTEWIECTCGNIKIRGGNKFLERDCKSNTYKELSIIEFPREFSFREDIIENTQNPPLPPGVI